MPILALFPRRKKQAWVSSVCITTLYPKQMSTVSGVLLGSEKHVEQCLLPYIHSFQPALCPGFIPLTHAAVNLRFNCGAKIHCHRIKLCSFRLGYLQFFLLRVMLCTSGHTCLYAPAAAHGSGLMGTSSPIPGCSCSTEWQL